MARCLFPLSLVVLLLLAVRLPAQQVGPPAAAAAPALGAPAFIPLPVKHQEYLDEVLKVWERRSNDIEIYRCEFQRWEFDTVFGPATDDAKRYSTGKVKFANPDKGLFQVEKILTYQAPAQPGAKHSYVELKDDYREHWICDGQSVFEFDAQRKTVVQQILPPQLQGKAIDQGPLPFLFRANADDLRRRFWMRAITPEKVKLTEIWLEAYPRTVEDAGNYLKVQIVFDRKQLLPKGLVIYDRNYVKGKNHSRTVFNFSNREVNFSLPPALLKVFWSNFWEPTVPTGWRKEVRQAPVQQALRSPLGGTR